MHDLLLAGVASSEEEPAVTPDITNATHTTFTSLSAHIANPWGHYFHPSGTRLFVTSKNNTSVFEFSLSTAWDISTISSTPTTTMTGIADIEDIAFSRDGSIMFLTLGGITTRLARYVLPSPWTIQTGLTPTTQTLTPSIPGFTAVSYSFDGLTYFVSGTSNDDITRFTVSNAYDIGGSSQETVSVLAQQSVPLGLVISELGDRIFVAGRGPDAVTQYDLPTPNVLTGYTNPVTVNVGAYEGSPRSVSFSTDGQNMYVVGAAGDGIDQFSL